MTAAEAARKIAALEAMIAKHGSSKLTDLALASLKAGSAITPKRMI